MTKKLLVLCMAAIMAVAALVAGCGSDQKAASDNKVLKVGTNADFAPFEFQDENGKEYQAFSSWNSKGAKSALVPTFNTLLSLAAFWSLPQPATNAAIAIIAAIHNTNNLLVITYPPSA